MEHSSTPGNTPSNLNPRQEGTRPSRYDKSISTDSTVVSSSYNTTAYDTEFNGRNMNQNEDTDKRNESNATLKMEDITKPIPNNTTDRLAMLYQSTDSDADLSPNFTSPHTLKRNLLDQDKIPDYKQINKTDQASRSDSISTGIRTTSGVNKRNISQLRKQLGEPLPLPYKVPKEAVPSNNISIKKPSIKYISSIRRQSLRNDLPTTPQVDITPLKPLTMERLEEKRNIITKRWKDLLIKDRIKVEEKLKELRSWDEESQSIASFGHKRQHSSSNSDSASVHNLRKPSREYSVLDTQRNSYTQLDSLDNISDMSDMSILKLQQEIETNSQKLDRILAVLEGVSNVKTTSKGATSIRTNFALLNISAYNLLWTMCIITLLVCQFYVWFYL